MSSDGRVAPTVVWFRRDLRLDDHPGWSAATAAGPVVALYVVDPRLDDAGPHRRSRWAGAVRALDDDLAQRGGRLRLLRGRPEEVVPEVVASTGAGAVHATADHSPFSRRRDRRVHGALDVPFRTWWANLVVPPGAIQVDDDHVPRVFSAFHRRWADAPLDDWPDGDPDSPVAADPGGGPDLLAGIAGPDLDGGAGAAGALGRLADFAGRVERYPDDRDRPGVDGTSGLSADLRFGTIAPRRIVAEVGNRTRARAAFVRQLAWRDWYAHLLWERPALVREAMKPESEIDWQDDPEGLAAWQEGRTGYPIVDAGMRQLAATGELHNRVRMICGSFLVKDLLIDWREGERWFRHQLVDFDVSQNVGNWQWVAGTGPDAAPYFRVFNPVTQSRRFDPEGSYLRRWLPELGDLADRDLHAPWEAPAERLADAGVVLGDTYPEPLVDHGAARDRALAAYQAARGD